MAEARADTESDVKSGALHLPPHPEEPRSGVSKGEATGGASWFETRCALLTMRV
jgi:hypothetical protein